jgi:hypothetical protein
MIGDAAVFANELIKPMFVDDAAPVRVGVGAVVCAGRRPIEGHAKPDLLSFVRRAEDEVQIAGAKAVANAPSLLVQGGLLFTDRPVTAQ